MSNVALTGGAALDGVLWGVKWDAPALTYGFPAAAADYAGYPDGGIVGFRSFNAAQIAAADALIAEVNRVVLLPITFTADAASANLRFGEATYVDQDGAGDPGSILTAIGTPPDPTLVPAYAHGDMFFNRSDYNTPVKGNYAYHTILHELGHSLGLKHGHEAQDYPGGGAIIPALPSDVDSMEFSVMTYRATIGGDPYGGYDNEQYGYAQSLMMLDIAALQYLYGADFATNAGNTVYDWSPATGEMFVNGTGQGAPGANRIFLTLWDGGGRDTYDFSSYQTDLTVDLNPGGYSITSAAQLAILDKTNGIEARGNIFNGLLYEDDPRSLIENAIGGSGADAITGNAGINVLRGGRGNDTLAGDASRDTLLGGIGNDSLIGGIGADTLAGGRGADTLAGGAGNDRFKYTSALEGGDRIADFSSLAKGNNDSFLFLGSAFGNLAAGAIDGSQFELADDGLATGETVRFIYSNVLQDLYFDPDGNGVLASALIAHLEGASPAVTLSDIVII